MPEPVATCLGIDLGTSHTVAVLRHADGRVEQLLFDSSPLLPSSVFAREDEILVGRDAIDSAHFDPPCFEPTPKRRIDDGTVLLGQREFTVVELFAAVLGRVRRECLEVAGTQPDTVVLTHPAAWGPTRILVLVDAAKAAGLGQPVLVPEPVAAAGYYIHRLRHEVPVGSGVVVHDFGGGTFDASVVRRTETGFDVLSVDGLDDLGGVDVDAAIVVYLQTQIDRPQDWQHLLSPDTGARRRARRTFSEDVRRVKEQLSRNSSADLFVSLLDVDVHLTRDELESLTRPLLERAIRVVQAVVRASAVPQDAMSGVFLVGGASRMPLVATMLHRELGHAPVVVDQLEQVVAHGALLSATTAARQPVPGSPSTDGKGAPPRPEPVLTQAPDPTPRVRARRPQREATTSKAVIASRIIAGVQILLSVLLLNSTPWIPLLPIAAFILSFWLRDVWVRRAFLALEAAYLVVCGQTAATAMVEVSSDGLGWGSFHMAVGLTAAVVIISLAARKSVAVGGIIAVLGVVIGSVGMWESDVVTAITGGAIIPIGLAVSLRPWRTDVDLPVWLSHGARIAFCLAVVGLVALPSVATVVIREQRYHAVADSIPDADIVDFAGSWPYVLASCESGFDDTAVTAVACDSDEPPVETVTFAKYGPEDFDEITAAIDENSLYGLVDESEGFSILEVDDGAYFWSENHPGIVGFAQPSTDDGGGTADFYDLSDAIEDNRP